MSPPADIPFKYFRINGWGFFFSSVIHFIFSSRWYFSRLANCLLTSVVLILSSWAKHLHIWCLSPKSLSGSQKQEFVLASKMRFKYNEDLSVFSQSCQKSSWSILIGGNVKNARGSHRLMETLLTSCFHSIWCFEQFYLSFRNFIWNQFKCKSEPRISLANRHRTDCSFHFETHSLNKRRIEKDSNNNLAWHLIFITNMRPLYSRYL